MLQQCIDPSISFLVILSTENMSHKASRIFPLRLENQESVAVLIVLRILLALRRLIGLLLRLLANLSIEQFDGTKVGAAFHFVVSELGSFQYEVPGFPASEVLTTFS